MNRTRASVTAGLALLASAGFALAQVTPASSQASSGSTGSSGTSGTSGTTQPLPVQVTFNPDPANPTAAVTETWTVPSGVTEVTFYVDGGAGGAGGQEGGAGGTGGTISANLAVTPGQTYAIVVAGSGADGASTLSGPGVSGGSGGAPGGGDGGSGSLQAPDYVGGGGGGGGQSTVALASGGSATLLLLAPGGGGGGGGNGSTLSGGGGGDGAAAGTGASSGAGGGDTGTADQGGAAGMSIGGSFGAPGAANMGGAGMAAPTFGGGAGGGGAGTFGGGTGGGSNEGAGGGGGGSYYVSTSALGVVMKTGASAGQVEIGYSTPNAPPPPPPVTKVQPHPSISGVAAVGAPLNCLPGVAVGAQATLTYQWLRDTAAIAGATAALYAPVAGDATHHLQCQVTATNSAGAVTITSSFVTVPAEGVPASVVETIVGHARDRYGHPYVSVVCSPQTPAGCRLTLIATSKETLRGSTVTAVAASTQHTVTVATATVTIASGQTRGISLPWTATGKSLLARERHLPASLAVSGTLVGAFNAPLRTQTLTLVAPSSLHKPK